MTQTFLDDLCPESSALSIQALGYCRKNRGGPGLLRSITAGFDPDSLHYHEGLGEPVSALYTALSSGAWRPAWILLSRCKRPLRLDQRGFIEAFPAAANGLAITPPHEFKDAKRALLKLIELGANPNAVKSYGLGALSSLWLSSDDDSRADLARLLLSLGCDPALKPLFGQPSVGLLARLAQQPRVSETLGLLIEAGLDPDTLDENKESALGISIRNSLWGNALILAKVANAIDQPDNAGRTPLSLASSAASSPFFPPEAAAVAALLIERGADPHQTRRGRQSCLDLLMSSRHPHAIALAQRVELGETLSHPSPSASSPRL